MSEVSDRYARVASGFESRLHRVRAGQWSEPTPCPGWSVADLVAHVITTHYRVVGNVEVEPAPEVDPGGDLPAQWAAATAAITSALSHPHLPSATVRTMFGERSFESLVGGLLCADTLFHTWDLARATGQDETMDAEAVAKAMEFLEPLDDAIRSPGGFAPKIEAAPGADAQTRFLNFGGRATD